EEHRAAQGDGPPRGRRVPADPRAVRQDVQGLGGGEDAGALPRDAGLPRGGVRRAVPVARQPRPRQHRAALDQPRGHRPEHHPAFGDHRHRDGHRRGAGRYGRGDTDPARVPQGRALHNRRGEHGAGTTVHRRAGSDRRPLQPGRSLGRGLRARALRLPAGPEQHDRGDKPGGPPDHRVGPRDGHDQVGGAVQDRAAARRAHHARRHQNGPHYRGRDGDAGDVHQRGRDGRHHQHRHQDGPGPHPDHGLHPDGRAGLEHRLPGRHSGGRLEAQRSV
ncbi:MAG: ABC transporter, permease protein (cluster 13, osmolytes), partial [uncultured Rubrobacteraceae bacterium]